MTKEQEEKLERLGREISEIFPRTYGKVYFQFNLQPNRREINMNYGVEMTKILK